MKEMKEIKVITVSREELEQLIDDKIEVLNEVISQKNDAAKKDPLLDIASIKANLKWSDGKARRLVREGRIRPEFTGNGKTMFFRLSQCENL